MLQSDSNLGELRLLLEEVCCDLCRFEHVIRDGQPPEAVRIDREYWLGSPGAFADIRVAPSGQAPYFVEVKYGYTNDRLVHHLARKYASPASTSAAAAKKIVLVVDRALRPGWELLEQELVSRLSQGLALEVWDEARLVSLLAERFDVGIPAITAENLLDVRQEIDRAKFSAMASTSNSRNIVNCAATRSSR